MNRALVAALLTVSLAGCVTHRDLSRDPRYRPFIGARYRLLEDIFVVRYTDGSGSPGSLMPASGVIGVSSVSIGDIGRTIDSKQILDVLERDSEFEVTRILLRRNFEAGDRVVFLIRPDRTGRNEWKNLQASRIQTKRWQFVGEVWTQVEPVMIAPRHAERLASPGRPVSGD
jgi:hypothetical protein